MLLLAAVVAASCDDGPEVVEPEGTPPARAAPAEIGEVPAEIAPAEDSVRGENVTVTVREDGRVHVRGTDRWGRAFDAIYQDGDYLGRAMPALERTFAASDVEVLRRVAASLPAGGP